MTGKNKTTTNAPDAAEPDTKSRIIAVAERMIAGRGIQQMSIRDITREAGVNLAAINYHFGSKERLTAEVLARQVTHLNVERMAMLDRLETDYADGVIPVESVLEIVFNLILCADDKARIAEHTVKMIGRFFMDPDAEVIAMLRPYFLPFKARVLKLLVRALPDIPREEVEWRTFHVFGLLNHYFLFADLHCKECGKKHNVKKELRRLVAFCAAGLKASPGAPHQAHSH
ncbi:MAG: TetR family transcriptional regulator [Opitutaceae bacterium]|jgi:AcrR family transcriptional regulator|nr:TetR family transcriptional regulator [Opitutaceae bacterium]